MKLAPNFIRSLFARSGSSPRTASGADVVAGGSRADDGETMLSPSTYHDARTGLTPSSLSSEETTSTTPDHEDLGATPSSDIEPLAEVASDSPSPPGARVLFQGREGPAEDQEPAEEIEEGEEEASNKTFIDESEEAPKAKSSDAEDSDDDAAKPETNDIDDDDAAEPKTSDEDAGWPSDDDAAEPDPKADDAAPEPKASDDAAPEPTASGDSACSTDSVETQEVDRQQPATRRTSSRLAAAQVRQVAAEEAEEAAAAAAAAERNHPVLRGAPAPENGPRPEPDFQVGAWLYAEWPTNHTWYPAQVRGIVFANGVLLYEVQFQDEQVTHILDRALVESLDVLSPQDRATYDRLFARYDTR